METESLIVFKDVNKSFGSNHVLKGVNLSIKKGEITVIIGKSGTGKSVLLKHIIGLMEQDSGEIYIFGTALSEMEKDQQVRFRQQLSYMFQGNALFDSMSAYDNIALPLVENSGFEKDRIRDLVQKRMEQLGISEIGQKYPSQLSGGMNKRVALARALVTDPKIVLFDEPTSGLDPVRKKNVHDMIRSYQEQFGFTAVIVSHDIPAIFDIGQHIAMLDSGFIQFEGNKNDVFSCRNHVVHSFINGIDISKGQEG